jgi:hypothetical protein
MTNSGIDHIDTEQIAIAAAWLAAHWDTAPDPHTRTLRERFGLGFNDAVKAMAEAKRIRSRGAP